MGWYRGGESNSQGYSPADFESAASTNSATPAQDLDCKRLRLSRKASGKTIQIRSRWNTQTILHSDTHGKQSLVAAASHH